MYYFAYGSNLSLDQMTTRCRNPVIAGPGVLKNYRLGFTVSSSGWGCGVADIVPAEGKEVWGLIYRLEEQDLRALDRYEGHPNFYKRVALEVLDSERNLIIATSYEVVKKEDFHPPSSEYLGIIKDAAEKYSFPFEYIRFLDSIRTIN
jgi:gamma-glutamylcyclotransferase (GGCT)/AIG2-like uncharacterized protein YtfP